MYLYMFAFLYIDVLFMLEKKMLDIKSSVSVGGGKII